MQCAREGVCLGLVRTIARSEADGIQAVGWVVRRRVGPVCVVEWLQRGCPAQPEGAKGAKDYEGERVANDPLLRAQSCPVGLYKGCGSRERTSPTEPMIISRPPKKK